MILLIDDRPEVRAAYQTTISREGFTVTLLSSDEFEHWIVVHNDISLSLVEGVVFGELTSRLEKVERLRSRCDVPMLALCDTIALDGTLSLYAAGADDVVRKPVHAREIIARLAAIRRRSIALETPVWSHGGLEIYGDGRDPRYNGASFSLPRRERRILEYLISCKGRRVTREQVFSAIYDHADDCKDESVIEGHVSKLRKKLRDVLGYDPIDSKRFLGYQFCGNKKPMAA